MKFIVNIPDNSPHSENLVIEALTYLDFRTVPTLTEAKHRHWYDGWFSSGINHREEQGMVVCEKKEKYPCYVIEIQDLEDLIKLQTKHGHLEIDNSDYLEISKEISFEENN